MMASSQPPPNNNNQPNNNDDDIDLNNRNIRMGVIATGKGGISAKNIKITSKYPVGYVPPAQGRDLHGVLIEKKDGKIKASGDIELVTEVTGTVAAAASEPAASTPTNPDGTKKYYPLGSSEGEKKRGRCVVLNYLYSDTERTRHGTEQDVARIKKVFGDLLNFKVKVYHDKSRVESEALLRYEATNIDSKYHCVVVFVLAHGEPGHFLCDIEPKNATDSPNTTTGTAKEENNSKNKFPYPLLFSLFDGGNCPKMAGKPKLFFIQACQGDEIDQGTKMATDQVSEEEPPTATPSGGGDPQAAASASRETQFFKLYSDPTMQPTKADQLVCCCSYSNHFSVRNRNEGSWFIQGLCAVLEQRWHDHDLDSMLYELKEQVKKKQLLRVKTEANVAVAAEIVKQIPDVTGNTLTAGVKFY